MLSLGNQCLVSVATEGRVCTVHVYHSHEGDGEVESLAEPSEGDEGLSGEATCGHLAEGLLELARRTLAHEPPHQQVHARAPVLTHTWHTAARPGIQLAVFT